MFMAAKDNQRGRYINYSGREFSVLDTQTGVINTLGVLEYDVPNGKRRTKDNGVWSEWQDVR